MAWIVIYLSKAGGFWHQFPPPVCLMKDLTVVDMSVEDYLRKECDEQVAKIRRRAEELVTKLVEEKEKSKLELKKVADMRTSPSV